MNEEKIKEILNRYKNESGALIPVMQDIQVEYRYLPKETLLFVARELKVPLSRIYSIANFYNAFSLKPKGEHLISVCLGTACHVRGGKRIAEEVERTLNIKSGETTPDLNFTLETVNCLGACALGPVVVVDGHYHGQMTSLKMKKLLSKLIESKGNGKDEENNNSRRT
ncbi:NAD(P)H-dependent oxidoreductase subunit E [Candidatus Desantisbacteria bacterium CG07_land_8_20_14_0_80_39_15]|uniref:NAD(P)H-dependent oxidoreductase subunit E n=1 Tax=Candidatus Desantisbacteria bacterium CG07_land_8_20_14_0_80_39_15 TaxID=1974549 RepID=A0A2M6ZHC3_9BACT|nr:MAG: NAD(P)H-dependent oxidoreductase subunit E [Candidatus Desantisbacteria bacterium CG07_land_8_20_14_0_80_39_15]